VHHFFTTFVYGTYHATFHPQHIHLNPHTHLINYKKEKYKETKEKQKTKHKHTYKIRQTTKTHNNNFTNTYETLFTIHIRVRQIKTIFHILNTLPTYKYIHFKTTFMCPRSIAGVLLPGASGLPYYCTLPVTVPDVIGGLTVWRHKNK